MPRKATLKPCHLLCTEDPESCPFKRDLATNGLQEELLASARERQNVLMPEATKPRFAEDWVWSRLTEALCAAFLQRMCHSKESSLSTRHLILDKLLNFSVPQFPEL